MMFSCEFSDCSMASTFGWFHKYTDCPAALVDASRKYADRDEDGWANVMYNAAVLRQAEVDAKNAITS